MIKDFIFDGQALSDFGYIAIFENSEDVIEVSAMQYENIKGALSDISHRVSYNYEQNYTSTFLIIKSECENNEDELWMTHDDISEMTRWLARKQYKWFRFIDEEDDDEIWYKVQVKVSKEYIGDRVLGLQLTVTANAPYGFTREIKKKIQDSEFTINAISDEEGYIYPDMTIEMLANGDFELLNEYENRITKIANCVAGEVITISGGDNLQISSSVNHDFTKDFNYVFPRLCNMYGDNNNIIDVLSETGSEYEATFNETTNIVEDIEFKPNEMELSLTFTATPKPSSAYEYTLNGTLIIDYEKEEDEEEDSVYRYHGRIQYLLDGRVVRTETFADTALLGDPMENELGTFDINDTVYSLTPDNTVLNFVYSGSTTAQAEGVPSNITLSYRGIRKVGFDR